MTEEEHSPAEPLENEQQADHSGDDLSPAEGAGAETPNRAGALLRRGLRWAVAFGLVFLLGVMLTWVLRVRPQADQNLALERSLADTRNQMETLQSELEDLRGLEEDNRELRQELKTKDHHLDLLAVLVDVTRSRLALAQDQSAEAAAALEGTDARLESLQRGLEGSDAEAVAGMRDRLNLVLNELETDTFAAQGDLEILTNNLVELERRIFGSG